jgi:hypothetical protein
MGKPRPKIRKHSGHVLTICRYIYPVLYTGQAYFAKCDGSSQHHPLWSLRDFSMAGRLRSHSEAWIILCVQSLSSKFLHLLLCIYIWRKDRICCFNIAPTPLRAAMFLIFEEIMKCSGYSRLRVVRLPFPLHAIAHCESDPANTPLRITFPQ